MSRDVVGNIEYGRVEVKDHIIKLISKTFNINENWLRNGKEPIFNNENSSDFEGLIKKYNLDPEEIDMIKKIVSVDAATRNKIIDVIFDALKENINKIDTNKVLHFNKTLFNKKEENAQEKVPIIARGKGLTHMDKEWYEKIMSEAVEVDYDTNTDF